MVILPGVLLEIVNLSKDFYYFIITTMTLTNWLLAATGIWGLALTWMWVFAAQNQATTEALNTNRPPMMREFGSGDMKKFMNPDSASSFIDVPELYPNSIPKLIEVNKTGTFIINGKEAKKLSLLQKTLNGKLATLTIELWQ